MIPYQPHRRYCIPLEGYRHMYRSLLRFHAMSKLDALTLLYPLYIGNLDTCQYEDLPLTLMELTPDGFYSLTEQFARPYHTEVQLYRSMIGLLGSINREATIQDTRQALRQFQALTDSLEYRFETAYDCEITDPKTTFNECWPRLIVRESEPLTVFKPAIRVI